jgi:hypothetical protein
MNSTARHPMDGALEQVRCSVHDAGGTARILPGEAAAQVPTRLINCAATARVCSAVQRRATHGRLCPTLYRLALRETDESAEFSRKFVH